MLQQNELIFFPLFSRALSSSASGSTYLPGDNLPYCLLMYIQTRLITSSRHKPLRTVRQPLQHSSLQNNRDSDLDILYFNTEVSATALPAHAYVLRLLIFDLSLPLPKPDCTRYE